MKVKRVCCRIIWQKTIDGHHLKNCRMTNQEATKGCQRIRVDSVMTGYDYVDLSGETKFPDQLISDDGKLERSYSHSFFFTSLLTLPPFPRFPTIISLYIFISIYAAWHVRHVHDLQMVQNVWPLRNNIRQLKEAETRVLK